MYLDYFGLDRPPFKITPDASMFFSGGERGNALEVLKYAVLNGEGIIKVVGEVGSGKTMLCRMLELNLPDDIEIVYIANPVISADNILHVIAFELGLHNDKKDGDVTQKWCDDLLGSNKNNDCSKAELLQKIQRHLLEKHATGGQVVIFIEEAQAMPISTLEEIRLLSNLETDTDKLLQIVLFGQPELDENLNSTEIRQLRERITHSLNLKPFSKDDVAKYLNFRMTIAGYHGPDIFSEKTARTIWKYSNGLLRRINIIADKSLLSAYADQTHNIASKHIMAAVKDSEFSGVDKRKSTSILLPTTIVIAIVVIVSAIYFYIGTKPESTTTHQQKVSAKKYKTDKTAILPSPPTIEKTLTQETKIEKEQAKKNKENKNQKTVPIPVQGQPLDKQKQSQNIPDDISPLQKKIGETNVWLEKKDNNTYTIQLLSVKEKNISSIKKYLTELKNSSEYTKIKIYSVKTENEKLYGILYGTFKNKAAAKDALNALPTILNANSPVLRTIKGIKKETGIK